MPKIKPEDIQKYIGTRYPEPFGEPCDARISRALSDAGGLTQFGVHETTLPPGEWASQRHWHSAEDEFIYILSGSCVLVDDNGYTPLKAGDSCAHKAGEANGHHLVNNSSEDVVYLIMGSRNSKMDHCHYPDIDLDLPADGQVWRTFKHKDGRAY